MTPLPESAVFLFAPPLLLGLGGDVNGVPYWFIVLLFAAAFGALGYLVRRSMQRSRLAAVRPVPRPLLDRPQTAESDELAESLRAEESLLSTAGGGDGRRAVRALGRVAALYAALGRTEDANLHRQAAAARLRRLASNAARLRVQLDIADFCRERGLLDDAAFWYDRAQREAERGEDPGLLAEAAGGRALIDFWRGDNREALRRLLVAQLALGESGYDSRRAWFLEIKGAVDAALGRVEQARRAYRKAAHLYRAMGRPDYAAPVHRATGDLYQHLGDIPGACAEWALARDLYARAGDQDAAHSLERKINRLSQRGA